MDSNLNEDRNVDAQPPKAVVVRMSLYLREVQRRLDRGESTVSSKQLGEALGIADTQVRKDFTHFGQFGYPGRGYRCEELVPRIRKILGTDRQWPMILVGCGNLGQALLGYRGFVPQGFSIAAAFDSAPHLIGRNLGGLTVQPMSQLDEFVQRKSVKIAILAVPEAAAQRTADALIVSGIIGILNFAPVMITVPKTVFVNNVDLTIQLEQLTYGVARQGEID